MDILKQAVVEKHKSLAAGKDTAGKRFFKRSEIQQKEIQKLREQEKHELEAKSQRRQIASTTTAATTAATATTTTTSSSSKSLIHEQNIDNLLLPKQDLIRSLRFLKQPITLFAEDDEARLDRLKYVLKEGTLEIDDSNMTQGQTNDFLRDIAELRKKKRKDSPADDKEDLKRMKEAAAANFEDDEDDKILFFFKRLLNEWKLELDEMTEAEKRTTTTTKP